MYKLLCGMIFDRSLEEEEQKSKLVSTNPPNSQPNNQKRKFFFNAFQHWWVENLFGLGFDNSCIAKGHTKAAMCVKWWLQKCYLRILKSVTCLGCTLRSGLREIPTMIRTSPHGLENNHACQWVFDNFPGLLTYILFLEICLKSICMHGCSPIHVERSFFFVKVWDRFVP